MTTTMPTDADSIRAAVIAHQSPWLETDLERDILEQHVDMGTPAVRIQCRADNGTGRRITAIITSGIRTMTGDFLPAHDGLPVTWENKPGRPC
jgi:hypothetical protein